MNLKDRSLTVSPSVAASNVALNFTRFGDSGAYLILWFSLFLFLCYYACRVNFGNELLYLRRFILTFFLKLQSMSWACILNRPYGRLMLAVSLL